MLRLPTVILGVVLASCLTLGARLWVRMTRADALERAIYAGNPSVVRAMLRQGVDRSTISDAVRIAITQNRTDILLLLLEHNPDLDFLDGDRMTALELAVEEGTVEMARAVLDHGGHAGDREPPLNSAAFWAKPDTVRFLLSRGYAVDGRNSVGSTALMNAAGQSEAAYPKTRQAASVLLAAGADVNARNPDGETALMVAAEQGNPAFLRLLLAHGADPTLRANNGHTALTLALSHQQSAIAQVLRQAGAWE